MSIKNMRPAALVSAIALVSVLVGLSACGGGTGGGNDLPGFAVLSAVRMGNLNGGAENVMPYPTQPPAGAVSVAPAVFAASAPGSQDFLELTFNVPLRAASILGGAPGTGGLAVFSIVGGVATPVGIALDSAGALNPANTFPTATTAPAVLKIYFDTDNNVLTPETWPVGDYVLSINNNLKSFTGGPFCTGNAGSNCVNTYLPALSFTIGPDMTPLQVAGGALAAMGLSPSDPLTGDPSVAINKEITIRFSEAVDFPSLVGAGNLTSNDPFITRPRVFTETSCGSTAQIPAFMTAGHLLVVYTTPTDPMSGVRETLPPNLGFVVYMPDPVLNPSLVRIRFVDRSSLTGTAPGQNYTHLSLPPIQPVPGSLMGSAGPADTQSASLTCIVMDPAFAAGNLAPSNTPSGIPILPPDAGANPPTTAADAACYAATTGATDRSGMPIPAHFQFTFTWAAGPPVASNPMPPDETIVVSQTGNLKGLAALNTASAVTDIGAPGTNSQAPITYGTAITGTMQIMTPRLANQQVLGNPLDVEIGAWINTMTPGLNNITNPGRLSMNITGVPDDPNGTTPDGLLGIIGACLPPCPPQQPWGNFLYVVDGDNGVVKVINGYNWQLITTLVGIADPRGLGMSPNLAFLYISNFGQSTVTRVFANPASPTLHTVTNMIQLQGLGPTAVAVQPQNKDVFVAEFVSNTYARITVGTQAVRTDVPTGFGPSEVVAGMEMLGMGLTNAYLAYVYNFFDDSISIFEEDSPAVPENDPDGKEVGRQAGLDGPQSGCWNWQSYITGTYEPGCFVANTQGSSVDEVTMYQFALSPPPGIQGLPGFRRFHVLKSYNGLLVGPGTASPKDASIDAHSGLYNVFAAGVTNNKGIIDPVFNQSGGVPSLVMVAFPATGLVGVFDYNSPALFGTVSVPGCDYLVSYYDQ